MRGSLDRSAGSAWCFAKGLINTTTKKEKKKTRSKQVCQKATTL